MDTSLLRVSWRCGDSAAGGGNWGRRRREWHAKEIPAA